MAIGPFCDYLCGDDNICGTFYGPSEGCGDKVAECGQLAVYDEAYCGSGQPGDPGNAISLPTSAAAKPFGVLLMDVYSIDQSKCHFWQDQFSMATTTCKPVKTVQKGKLQTDWLDPEMDPSTIVPGCDVYFNERGFTTDPASESVGKWAGKPNSCGFAMISFCIC